MTKGMDVQCSTGSGRWAEIIANRLHLISFKKGNYLNRARFYISTQYGGGERAGEEQTSRSGGVLRWSGAVGGVGAIKKIFPREESLFVQKS
jgi:hypothetical protein